MTKLRTAFVALLYVFFLATAPFAAQAAPAVVPAKPETRSPLFTPMVEQLGQQFQSLVIGTTASDGDQNDESNVEPTPTFGSRALNLVITAADLLGAQAKIFVTNFAALPQLSDWFDQQRTDPRAQSRWTTVGNDLLHTIGISFLAALVLDLILFPARRALRKRRLENARGRFATLLTLFFLRAAPILVFIGVSVTLLDQNETQKFSRFIILNVVYALALSRIVIAIIRGVLAPHGAALRLTPISDAQAKYGYYWLSAYSLIIIYAYFFGDLARAARVPAAVITSFANIFGFLLVLMTVIVISQKRAFVAVLLRGHLSAAQQDTTWLESLRLWLARYWHVLAIAYIVIGYAVAALGVENGFALMLRGTILTLLVFVITRWLFGLIDRWGAKQTASDAVLHRTILRFLLRIVVGMLAVIGIVGAWGADIPSLFATPFGQRVLGSVFSISITVLIVAVIYDVFSSKIDRHLSKRDEESKALQASARAQTLLPMIRNTIFIVLASVVALMVLSEVGFNIGPVLAGAGVVGVAVGFGSQTLVKDFLTGLFIVVENTIAIGDVVKIADHSGVVEAMSIRTLRLRDQDGALHILPFSEVTKIVNMTRGFAFAVINVGVAYSTDLDRAMSVIREVGDEMQKDPIFKRVILEPIEVLGIDNLGDYSITILSRLRTRPGKQWDVKRMFLLKLKQRFDKEGIEIPFPTNVSIQRLPAAPPK